MFPYEKEVKASLKEEVYDTCLYYCDDGKIQTRQICEIASQLDPRIRTKLFSQPASVQTSPRDSFRCVMSEWYNIAAESESTSIPFRLDTLIDVLRNDNVRLFELARELAISSYETIEDRSRTKVKGITFRRFLPYQKPRSISLGGSYTSISGGGAASQSNLREASNEFFLQSPCEGRQRNTGERALSPKERNGIVKEIIGQVWGSLKHFIDPAALGSQRSLKSIGSLDSISEEHHPDNFSKSEACLYNPEAEPVSLYNEVTDSVVHHIGDDMTLLKEFQSLVKHLKIHSQFPRCASILEATVQKCSMRRSQSLPAIAGEGKNERSVPNEPKTKESSSKRQFEDLPQAKEYGACDHEVKAGTPIQKKDISVIINHTLLTPKQKDIIVFNKLANKLGVGTVISKDIAKKKPNEIMKIVLRTWWQNKDSMSTAEELLAALNYSTEGMKQDIFQTLKPILRKLIEENKKPRTSSKTKNSGKLNTSELTRITKKHNRKK